MNTNRNQPMVITGPMGADESETPTPALPPAKRLRRALRAVERKFKVHLSRNTRRATKRALQLTRETHTRLNLEICWAFSQLSLRGQLSRPSRAFRPASGFGSID